MACDTCPMRKRFERNPRSLLGRLWLWHTGWCPGWKRWLASLQPTEREAVLNRIRAARERS
ncbi:MAG TPA: hypothetical protein PKX28_04880 [Candidatus Hydrogenedentes bacterium]|nr:hypothetical protein [Candidatus Hydrogenedentota bacterium]HOJ67981.1 hypothetical protein [Candidatus Hydrogenedentota bacterium]HOK89691.1 hypothetical protein [Candidatus Hydrogenedentota bacterium]HOV60967.1 hypothetical protein [Candidatus Hydrogenedentota bacterium]HPO30553.1 hypothetical protein [Candidatus Hydrogenedentota bacterium]